jgi:hypothetical protein
VLFGDNADAMVEPIFRTLHRIGGWGVTVVSGAAWPDGPQLGPRTLLGCVVLGYFR